MRNLIRLPSLIQKHSGLALREEKHRKASSTHDQPQSVQRLFQLLSDAKTMFTIIISGISCPCHLLFSLAA